MIRWRTARLEEVAEVLGGGTPSRQEVSYFGGGIPWATPTDITALNALHITKTKETITEDGLQNSSTKLLPKGAVLLTSRATIGYTAVAEVPICTNQGFVNFVCGPQLIPEFLAFWLRTQKDKMIQHAGGTTFKEIARGTLRKFEISFPPLNEQRHIVDLLSRAEGIIRLRREAQKKAAAIIPALFLDMFGDPATNPKGFATARLAEIADVVSGITKGRKLNGKAARPVPYLRVANVQAGFLNLSEIKVIDASESEIESLALQAGDIVLTEGGDFDKLGRGAQWRGELSTCIHQNHVFRVRLKRGVAEPDYFEAYLQTVAAKNYFLSVAKRTTNLASINMTQLKHLPVVLPSIEAQRQFADRVMFAHSIIRLHAIGLAKAQATFTSILGRVFLKDTSVVERERSALEEAVLVPEG